MQEKDFRNKIIWFTFIFSLLVIWVHSYNAALFLGANETARGLNWIERLLGDRVAQTAVPGFFLISSYLFFRNFKVEKIWMKWNSRIRSVLVPYILWNFLYYLGYVIGSRIPGMAAVIGKGKIPFDFLTAADAVLHYEYNYVFWYLYQLILLIILAPLIYPLIKKRAGAFIFLSVIFCSIYFGGSLPVLNLDALFYYSFGAAMAVHIKKSAEGSWNLKRFLMGLCFLLLGIIIRDLDFPGSLKGEIAASTVLFRLMAPVGLWLMVSEGILPEPKEWMKHNFFLYAVHFAVVRLINKTGAMLLPPVPALAFLLYLFMPALCVFLSYWIGWFLRSFLPALWRLLNGGRQ